MTLTVESMKALKIIKYGLSMREIWKKILRRIRDL